MSEHLHSVPHPDADRLSAFMEGALTEPERQECLAHLAACSECRSVVFLAQEAVPAPPVELPATPAWRRWLPPLSLAAAAAACGLIAVLWMHSRPTPTSPTNTVAAVHQGAQPTSAPLPEPAPAHAAQPADSRNELKGRTFAPPRPATPISRTPSGATGALTAGVEAPAAQPAAKLAAPAVAGDQAQGSLAVRGAGTSALAEGAVAGSAAIEQQNPGAVPAMRANSANRLAAPAATPTVNGALAQAAPQNALLDSARAVHLTIEHNQTSDKSSSAIHGTVTDPSGAILAGASITLRASSGETAATTTTDEAGRFELASVTPGQYELQISAHGFDSETERLDLEGGDLALLSPALRVGAASQTVEVTAATTAIPTSTKPTDAELAALVPTLPSKLPSATTVVRNGRILALDTAGTLYLSRDAGQHWKRIRPVWTGSVAHLAVAEPAEHFALKKKETSGASPSIFELTTTDGALWISSDGAHWRLR